MTLQWAHAGFNDYNFWMFCTICRKKYNTNDVWKKNRCKECHNKLRTIKHRGLKDVKRY